VGVDATAQGANANVSTDNVQAGEIACDYLAKKINGKGKFVIINGPQIVGPLNRVKGCKSALAKYPAITLLSDDQHGDGSRETGLNIMQTLLTRFATVDAVFAINDQEAIGADLAARQLHRSGIAIAGVDGAPEVEQALRQNTQIVASASQDPYALAVEGVRIGNGILHGQRPAQTQVLVPSRLITRENIVQYRGWTSDRTLH